MIIDFLLDKTLIFIFMLKKTLAFWLFFFPFVLFNKDIRWSTISWDIEFLNLFRLGCLCGINIFIVCDPKMYTWRKEGRNILQKNKPYVHTKTNCQLAFGVFEFEVAPPPLYQSVTTYEWIPFSQHYNHPSFLSFSYTV